MNRPRGTFVDDTCTSGNYNYEEAGMPCAHLTSRTKQQLSRSRDVSRPSKRWSCMIVLDADFWKKTFVHHTVGEDASPNAKGGVDRHSRVARMGKWRHLVMFDSPLFDGPSSSNSFARMLFSFESSSEEVASVKNTEPTVWIWDHGVWTVYFRQTRMKDKKGRRLTDWRPWTWTHDWTPVRINVEMEADVIDSRRALLKITWSIWKQ